MPGIPETGPGTDDLDIVVIIPCHNEATAIASVVAAFRSQLPAARIYVYDNNSSDNTAIMAENAGAFVGHESQQGKGHVVRRMFSDIEASVYVLVDGDGTYDAASVRPMMQVLMDRHCDMVSGRRVSVNAGAYRFGHEFGNRMLSGIVNWIFGKRCLDMLSGYRIFSRRFVKSFPALSTGFEIETELTVHALSTNMPVAEVDTPYSVRSGAGTSKLNTYRDGLKILWTIVSLTKHERPLFFFSIISLLLVLMALALGLPVVLEFLETGLVLRFPTAFLSASIMVLAFISFATGLILDSVARGRREAKRLHYLALDWLGRTGGDCRGGL